MNSTIASNINGGVSNQQVANGSYTSVLSSSIEFSLTETKTNFYAPSLEGKYLIKLTGNGKEEIFNGQNKANNQLCEQNKTKNQLCEQNKTNNQLCEQNKTKNQLCEQNKTKNQLCEQNKVRNHLYDQSKAKNQLCDQNENLIESSYLALNGIEEKSEDTILPIPKVQLYTGKIYVEWNQVHKIGAGLNNLGNTCFMNTVIQCLTYCPPLANYLLHDNDHAIKCSAVGFCMMCLLQKHMKRVIGKTGEVIKPIDVFHRLKVIAKHFQFGRQEDAHEFLRYVIDHLWKACLPQANGVTKLDSASKETTVINRIFGGYHRSQVICLQCKEESNTYDYFMDFILDIKQNVMSLEKALEKFIQPELLQQENCYKCPKCKMKVDAQKRFSVYRAPTVATFQLKRFDYNRAFGGKITKQITYPEKLNLRPFMSDTQGDPVWYRLNAVLVHSGASCNSGHYYCYVKNSNGCWYIMDDQRVHQVSLNQVLNQSAYVLFYIKMENAERTTFKKCLDNKSTYTKSTNSNSHFVKTSSELSNLKPLPINEKISPFSRTKSYVSPNGIKKFNISNQNREKVSFGLRTNGSLTSPKNKIAPSETVTSAHSGLVPYVEDSSESSDASEGNVPQNTSTTVSQKSVKHPSKTDSLLDSYRASPNLVIKTKLSKSFFSKPSPSSPASKVSATESWIVTDAPQTSTASRSSSSGVSSTTDWQVIEASDLKLNDPLKTNVSRRESSDSVEALFEISKHSHNSDCGVPSATATKPTVHETSPSAQKCDFRKQLFKDKTHVSEEEEMAGNCSKRKYSDSYSKISKDSHHTQHSESRHSPIPKKAKYAENSSLVNHQEDNRNSSLNVVNTSDNSSVQRQYSVSYCDNESRTSVVNGVVIPVDRSRGSSSQNGVFNGSLEKDSFFKGRSDNSFPESKHYEKGKSPISNQGKNSSLYGTDVPTWRGENHYRPSVIPAHESRRSFDSYDHELDCGKVRKFRVEDRHQMFRQRNSFQKQADRYYGKHKGKYFDNHHHNNRRYNSNNWKPNHNYQRYQNHHRYY